MGNLQRNPCLLVQNAFVMMLFIMIPVLASRTSSRRNAELIHPGKRVLFALFGDSITSHSTNYEHQGWAIQLDNYYGRKIDILNRGHSGYNTRWAKMLFPNYFQQLPINDRKVVAFLFFGANDASNTKSRTHVPIEEYKENMKYLLQQLQKPSKETLDPKNRVIVVISPPPIDPKLLAERFFDGNMDELDRSNEVTGAYARAAMEIAKEQDGWNDVHVYRIDLFSRIMSMNSPPAEFLYDGLHLSKKGNILLFNMIRETLDKEANIRPMNLPGDFPEFMKVDHQDPENSFQYAKKS